jgi:hypothetical protein
MIRLVTKLFLLDVTAISYFKNHPSPLIPPPPPVITLVITLAVREDRGASSIMGLG